LLIAIKLLSGILEQRNIADDPVAAGHANLSRRAGPVPAVGGQPSGATPSLTVSGDGGLLSAALVARDSLRRDGLRLTRDALAARLRQDGHRVGNARLTSLLRQLRSNPT
jgi:hypothetical protein